MKIFKLLDIERMLTEQGYKFVCLCDSQGKQILPYNSVGKTTTTALERFEDIKKQLNSEALPDGYYIVKCKMSMRTNHFDPYTIYKGQLNDSAPVPVAPLIVEKPTFQPEVLTYEGALKLQIELERYKLENAALKKEIESLKAEIDNLESETMLSEEQDDKNELLSNAKSFLSEIVSFAAPLLDKHFELKEKALGLKAIELNAKTNFAQRPKPAPEQKTQDVTLWIKTFEEEPETYNSLVEIYNKATGLNNFYESLRAYDEQLFKNCLNYGK